MIGLMGGLGIGAGIHYYRELAAAHLAEGRPLALALVHAEMSRAIEYVTAGDRPGLARYLGGLLSNLHAAGATIGVIPAVTPHLVIEELRQISPIPIVNLLDVVAREVTARGLRRVALFGTRFVIESDFFGALEGATVVRPSPAEIEIIGETYLQIARSGQGTREQRETLTKLAGTLCAREDLDAILLAGTDLSLVFDESNTEFPHLDCARAHIQAIMRSRAGTR
jgi:aspartate racemase